MSDLSKSNQEYLTFSSVITRSGNFLLTKFFFTKITKTLFAHKLIIYHHILLNETIQNN